VQAFYGATELIAWVKSILIEARLYFRQPMARWP